RLFADGISQRAASEIFLSQAGPQFDFELLKLSITFCLTLSGRPFNKKATRSGVALVWLASAARDLAQRAPSEGYDVAVPADRIAAMQARQSRCGDGRFGEK